MTEPLSFEKSRPNAHGPRLPEADVKAPGPSDLLPRELLRSLPPGLPRLSEPEIMRHYARLASLNYSISEQFYPLGSCTMKYNPVANEAAAALPGFTDLHPYQDEDTVQGALSLMWRLEQALCAVVGVERVTRSRPQARTASGPLCAIRRTTARAERLAPKSWCPTRPTAPTPPAPPSAASTWSRSSRARTAASALPTWSRSSRPESLR